MNALAPRTLILFTGIQGSGKTSFYQNHLSQYAHINLDTLRTRSRERLAFERCLQAGESLVVDNTNPTRETRQRYIQPAKQAGYRVVGLYFASSLSACIRRNALREGKARVPEQAIACTLNRLELPAYDEGFDALYYVHYDKNAKAIVEDWREDP